MTSPMAAIGSDRVSRERQLSIQPGMRQRGVQEPLPAGGPLQPSRRLSRAGPQQRLRQGYAAAAPPSADDLLSAAAGIVCMPPQYRRPISLFASLSILMGYSRSL